MSVTLTQLVLQVAVLVVLHVFVLAEEVLVNVPSSEQPHVRVVGDGPVGLVGAVQRRTLSLGLHRSHEKRNTKQPQQLLFSNTERWPDCIPHFPQPPNAALWNNVWDKLETCFNCDVPLSSLKAWMIHRCINKKLSSSETPLLWIIIIPLFLRKAQKCCVGIFTCRGEISMSFFLYLAFQVHLPRHCVGHPLLLLFLILQVALLHLQGVFQSL